MFVVLCFGCGGAGENASASFPTEDPAAFEWLGENGVQCIDLSASDLFDSDQRMCLVAPDEDTDGPAILVKAGRDSLRFNFGAEFLETDASDSELVAEHLADLFAWPSGTASRMMTTRALDGQQQSGNATWTYHGKDGFNVVVVPPES